MYKEFKMIGGYLHWRGSPDDGWTLCTLEEVNGYVADVLDKKDKWMKAEDFSKLEEWIEAKIEFLIAKERAATHQELIALRGIEEILRADAESILVDKGT